MIRLLLFLCIGILLMSFFFSVKEGIEEDYLSLSIQSIRNAIKDPTMSSRKDALEDALRYATYIKNM